MSHPNYPTTVESLQPTFEWEAQPGAEGYDLIVYEGIRTESFWEGVKRAVGREIYYRENPHETKHTIEERLKQNSEYYWSVRMRRGTQVTKWSLYNYDVFLGTAYVYFHNQPYIFRTPKAPEQAEPK